MIIRDLLEENADYFYSFADYISIWFWKEPVTEQDM